MLKLLGQPSPSHSSTGIREEGLGSSFYTRRIGVEYGKSDAEELIHLLKFLAEFGERTAIHPDELPRPIFANKKYEAKDLLMDFEKFDLDQREINGRVTVRFEYRGFTRWLIKAYIEELDRKLREIRDELDNVFTLDLADPLFYPRDVTDAHRVQMHWQEIRAFYLRLLDHFPDHSQMN